MAAFNRRFRSPPPPDVSLPNIRSGRQEGLLFMAVVAVLAIASVVQKTIGSSSPSKPDSPVEDDPNNEAKDTVVEEKPTTEICHSGKLEGNKLNFSAELSAYPLVMGEPWVALKDQTVFTPEKFVIKQGQIGIVTKLEDFLTAVLTFDMENKEDLSSFLEKGGNYLVPFIPLSYLLPPP